MEINNQTRSKVSKPNKLDAEKKLLGNIRYFPMQLIERWLRSFAGVSQEHDLKLLWPLFHKRLCWSCCPPIPQALGRFTTTSKDQQAEGTKEGYLKVGHSTDKGAAVAAWIRAFSGPSYPPLQYYCSSSIQKLLCSCVQCTWWSITDLPWWGLSMLLWISTIWNASPQKRAVGTGDAGLGNVLHSAVRMLWASSI